MTAGNLFPIIDSFRDQAASETIPERLHSLDPQHVNVTSAVRVNRPTAGIRRICGKRTSCDRRIWVAVVST